MIEHKDQLDALRETVKKTVEAGFKADAEKRIDKKVREIVEEISGSVEYEVAEAVADHIAYLATETAGKIITAIINGDQAALLRAIQVGQFYTGREGTLLNTEGSLWEVGAIELRRRIVDEHPDLIRSERIKDLEAQVKALEAKNVALHRDNRKLNDEARARS